jgi:hypothetical protein
MSENLDVGSPRYSYLMKIKVAHTASALVELTLEELVVINNALNEVCNGIRIENEFYTRMGCTVESASELLAEINQLIQTVRSSN